MSYFFTLENDLPAGVGFAHWGGAHIAWLAFSAALIAALCARFDAPEALIAADVGKALAALREVGALEE